MGIKVKSLKKRFNSNSSKKIAKTSPVTSLQPPESNISILLEIKLWRRILANTILGWIPLIKNLQGHLFPRNISIKRQQN
jgi:hypothetical protein